MSTFHAKLIIGNLFDVSPTSLSSLCGLLSCIILSCSTRSLFETVDPALVAGVDSRFSHEKPSIVTGMIIHAMIDLDSLMLILFLCIDSSSLALLVLV